MHHGSVNTGSFIKRRCQEPPVFESFPAINQILITLTGADDDDEAYAGFRIYSLQSGRDRFILTTSSAVKT